MAWHAWAGRSLSESGVISNLDKRTPAPASDNSNLDQPVVAPRTEYRNKWDVPFWAPAPRFCQCGFPCLDEACERIAGKRLPRQHCIDSDGRM